MTKLQLSQQPAVWHGCAAFNGAQALRSSLPDARSVDVLGAVDIDLADLGEVKKDVKDKIEKYGCKDIDRKYGFEDRKLWQKAKAMVTAVKDSENVYSKWMQIV